MKALAQVAAVIVVPVLYGCVLVHDALRALPEATSVGFELFALALVTGVAVLLQQTRQDDPHALTPMGRRLVAEVEAMLRAHPD